MAPAARSFSFEQATDSKCKDYLLDWPKLYFSFLCKIWQLKWFLLASHFSWILILIFLAFLNLVFSVCNSPNIFRHYFIWVFTNISVSLSLSTHTHKNVCVHTNPTMYIYIYRLLCLSPYLFPKNFGMNSTIFFNICFIYVFQRNNFRYRLMLEEK